MDSNKIILKLSKKEPFVIPKSLKNKGIYELVSQCTKVDPNERITINNASYKLKTLLLNRLIEISKVQNIAKLYKDKESKSHNKINIIFII